MAPPEGYAPKDGKVCFLLKGVEGLKQGANGFMKLNAKVIEGEGFSRSMLDPTVFIRTKDGIVLKVACYVDNLLCAYPRGERGRAQCAEFFKAYGKKINLEIRTDSSYLDRGYPRVRTLSPCGYLVWCAERWSR